LEEEISEEELSRQLREKKKKNKKLGTNRGIETLFRNIYRVHVEVSALADTKANFLISVNSIIMILVVAHGMQYVTHKGLLIPIGIVMATSIGSMIFAVLVARPRFNKNIPHVTGLPIAKPNLLFFGSFAHMEKDAFIDQFTDMIQDPEALYKSMMGDVYEMGLILQKKYSRLKAAYCVLLYGMPLGVIIFVIMESIIVFKALD